MNDIVWWGIAGIAILLTWVIWPRYGAVALWRRWRESRARHQAEDASRLRHDAGDVLKRAVGIGGGRDLAGRGGVTEDDAAFALQAPPCARGLLPVPLSTGCLAEEHPCSLLISRGQCTRVEREVHRSHRLGVVPLVEEPLRNG